MIEISELAEMFEETTITIQFGDYTLYIESFFYDHLRWHWRLKGHNPQEIEIASSNEEVFGDFQDCVNHVHDHLHAHDQEYAIPGHIISFLSKLQGELSNV